MASVPGPLSPVNYDERNVVRINDEAAQRRPAYQASEATNAAASLQAERRAAAERAAEADLEYRKDLMFRRYRRWLKEYNVPPTEHYNRKFIDRISGHKGRSWSQGEYWSDGDQHGTYWSVSVHDNGWYHVSYGLTYEQMRECVIRMVTQSGVPWPYDD